ncbi:MAG: molybdopterin-binding protein [Salinarimonas sp.]
MSRFDRVVIVDWSASARRMPARPRADAIWIGISDMAGDREPLYCRSRAEAMATIEALCEEALATGERLLIGFDFPLGYPRGLAEALTGRAEALALWEWLAGQINDGDDNANNRFDIAAAINRRFPGIGPFWGRPASRALPDLPERGLLRDGHGLPERRLVEERVPRAQPCWKLFTTGSVGSQALLGIPRLQTLRERFADALTVWPFEKRDAPITLAEIYPSLLDGAVNRVLARDPDAIKDAVQVRLLAATLMAHARDALPAAMRATDASEAVLREEGWILGVGCETLLRETAQEIATGMSALEPPRLQNDCFALPPGVDWTPVDDALRYLRAALRPVAGIETLPTADALGRVLARDTIARRSNPPAPNAAVDGYGFAHAATGEGPQQLPLIDGRAAAGVPYTGKVPHGQAIRILTGAILPEGVDTVVLEEDCATDGARIAFNGPIKPRSNTRKAGEDVAAGTLALPAGRLLTPADLALLSALGIGEVAVHRRLRVGVLSTGEEIVGGFGDDALAPGKIYDANRPMLLAMAQAWHYRLVDLGHVGDDRDALRARLDAASREADVIFTSGGASAGDEDHVSALLRESGALQEWRIAIKPGRPLALALWNGVPVFGLPGNPVAAFVCALIFARPALAALSGAGWCEPLAFTVPAAFSKNKKPGRREYLRARLDAHGAAEVFASEGSGRISGLSWATGLVEIGDGAQEISPGDPVRFMPYAGFGI